METQLHNKIKDFTDLDAWKEGHKLVIIIYEITKKFPSSEVFGLSNQMRRAAVSITSNLAEGFGRFSYKEKSQFYLTAIASATELQNQLIICRDTKYIDREMFNEIYNQTIKVHKIINGLIKGARKRSKNS